MLCSKSIERTEVEGEEGQVKDAIVLQQSTWLNKGKLQSVRQGGMRRCVSCNLGVETRAKCVGLRKQESNRNMMCPSDDTNG